MLQSIINCDFIIRLLDNSIDCHNTYLNMCLEYTGFGLAVLHAQKAPVLTQISQKK